MSKKLKYIVRLTAVLMMLGTMMIQSELKATHIVGADMTFTCLANEMFQINLTVRRDCFNGDPEAVFDDPAFVGIYDAFGTPLNWLGSLGVVKLELVSVEDLDPGALGCIPEGQQICVSEARYVGTVYLPFREKGYILGYQRCCRNVTLNNIVSPLETGNTSFVCITEESLNTCNSGPAFGDWPAITICAGESLTFDASATDADGDSLSYMLYTPHAGASLSTPQPIPPAGPPYDEVEFAPGFSLENVLGSGTPLVINSETGIITATPSATGQFLVGILVTEWRNGMEVSKTRRNFEYNVIICDPSKLLSFNAPDTQCEGLTVQFENTTVDQNRSFMWNFDYPNEDSAFMSTEVSPTFTYPERGTYMVRMTAEGGPETCNSEVIKTVKVIDSQLSASFDSISPVCRNDTISLNLVSTSIEPDQTESIVSTVFEVTADGVTYSESGENVTINLPCASEITVSITATSSNTCTATFSQIFSNIPVDTMGMDTMMMDTMVSIQFIGDTLYICPDESTALVSNPNSSWMYSWDPTEGLDLSDPSNPIASPSVTTTYTVIVTDGEASDTGSVTVVAIDDLLSLEIENNSEAVCVDTASLSAIVNNDIGLDITYEWAYDAEFSSIVATGKDVRIPIIGSSSTIYLRAEGVRFCGSNVPSIVVDREIPGISVEFEAINICVTNEGSATIINSNPDNPITVRWDSSENITSSLDDLSVDLIALPGQTEITLSYSAVDSQGCMKIDTFSVPVIDDLIVGIEGGPSVCAASSVYSATANVPIELVSFEWSLDPDFSTILSTDSTFTTDAPAGSTVYLRGSTESGCMSEVATIVVQENPGMLMFDAPRRICVGDTADIDLIIPAGDDLTVTWDPAPEIISGLNDPKVVVVGMDTGNENLVLSYTATDGDSCILMDTIIIPYSTVIDPAPDPQIQCGTHEVLFNIDPIYIDGDVLWNFGELNGEEVTSTEARPTIDFGMPGNYSASLMSTMETCNFDDLSIDFVVPEILELSSADTSLSICEGDSIFTLGASTPNDVPIIWTDQDGNELLTGDSITVDIRELSSVIATISDTFGCSESITFDLSPYMFDISIDGPSGVVCGSDPIMISATDNTGADLSYMWISETGGVVSGGDTPNPTIDPANAEDLRLEVVNNDNGCTESIPFPVTGGIDVNVSISSNPGNNIVLGQTVDLMVTTDAASPTYQWSDGSSTSTINVTPGETTTYTVTVTDENGCTGEASITINVEIVCDASSLFVPDAFSPNNDNVNDLLFVRLNGAASVDFQILDRWGKEVFRTMNQSEGWNGRHRQNGDELSPDVYAYCVKVTCPDGSEIIKAGNVSLIR